MLFHDNGAEHLMRAHDAEDVLAGLRCNMMGRIASC